jgi:hypothetical protein
MKSLVRIVTGALVALGLAGPAAAGPLYYTFDFSGDGVVGSGTLITSGTTDPVAPLSGADDILSISGTVDGEAITGLLGTAGPVEYSPDGYFLYDNDFYAAGSASAAGGYFDDDGLLFTLSGGGDYNLFFDGSTYWDWADQGSGIAVSFSAVDPPPPAVPEPSSGLLLATALMGLPFAARRWPRLFGVRC